MDPFGDTTKSCSYRDSDKAHSSTVPAEETVEWIVTFKPAFGIIIKIEKLHSESGGRQELSIEEYVAVTAMGIPVTVPSMSVSSDAMPTSGMSRAYYQGVYDYLNYINCLAWLYYQKIAGASPLANPDDPIDAQRLSLARYAVWLTRRPAAPLNSSWQTSWRH
jgi:hypothetical protein